MNDNYKSKMVKKYSEEVERCHFKEFTILEGLRKSKVKVESIKIFMRKNKPGIKEILLFFLL